MRTGIKNINGQRSQPLPRLHYPGKLNLQKHNAVIHADVGINLRCKALQDIDIKQLISGKQYIQGLSKDDNHISYRRVMLIKHCCSAHELTHQVINFVWNHLPDRKWINQKIELNAKGRGVLNGYLIGFL
ncbi:MAG TPA: hypothetical protein VJ954_04500 [Ignavibacteriaceae bacterium]|nr:hypothetical protein [Ignavibacteriaceae bacterium]